MCTGLSISGPILFLCNTKFIMDWTVIYYLRNYYAYTVYLKLIMTYVWHY